MNSDGYILDSNIFIEAARRYYPLDFAGPFWDGLIRFAEQGLLMSCDRVYDELKRGDDDLAAWVEKHYITYFLSTQSDEVLANYAKLVQWAIQAPLFNDHAKDEFMEAENADAWILAYALTHGGTIVTHETFDPLIKKRIPIPNVCKEFDIAYCDTFEMLRRLKFSF